MLNISGFSPANILRTIAGTGEAGPLVSGRTVLIGAAVAGVAAFVGWELLRNRGGSGGDSGSGGGTSVGIAHGYKQVGDPQGTGSWQAHDGTMLLNRHLGSSSGYPTLADAIAAVHPNADNTDDMAFVRTGDHVDAWSIKGGDVDAVDHYEATDPSVLAFTTPLRGDVLAGPGATADEIAQNHLATN